jgi:hypothetical protein|tara:strand:+ start:1302 stop:1898 length:597 start_codon:yes stop_codon:yes gene_type:complete
MITRKQHRLLGGILLLPFIAWSLTGVFFLVRPAYEQAYSVLSPKTYSADQINISAQPEWQEMRLLKTVLGLHLLVKQEGGWQQLDPDSLEVRATPVEADLVSFVEDAISQDTLRYGELLPGESDPFRTSTGVTIAVNWDSLSLYQQGLDTRWIDRIYRIHYLQWTGIAFLDTILGVAGLLLLLLMTATGSAMLLRREE